MPPCMYIHTHPCMHALTQPAKQSLQQPYKNNYCHPVNQLWDVCTPLRNLGLVQANSSASNPQEDFPGLGHEKWSLVPGFIAFTYLLQSTQLYILGPVGLVSTREAAHPAIIKHQWIPGEANAQLCPTVLVSPNGVGVVMELWIHDLSSCKLISLFSSELQFNS